MTDKQKPVLIDLTEVFCTSAGFSYFTGPKFGKRAVSVNASNFNKLADVIGPGEAKTDIWTTTGRQGYFVETRGEIKQKIADALKL